MKRISLLLVDDDFNYRKIVQQLLETSGFEVNLAANGNEAFQHIKNHKFDIVLMDIQMPFMDGLTAAKLINQLDPIERPIMVASSAFFSEDQKLKLKEAGFDELLVKPLNIKEVIELGNKSIRQSSTNNSVSRKMAILNLAVVQKLSKYGGKADLLPIYDNFVEESNLLISQLKKVEPNKEASIVKSILHTLKGNAGSVGADKLSACAKQLETRIKENNFENWQQHFQELEDFFLEFRINYRNLLT